MENTAKDTTPTHDEARVLLALQVGGEVQIRGVAWIRLDEDYKASPYPEDYDRNCEWWSSDEIRESLKAE